MSDKFLKLLTAIDNGANAEVIRMYQEEGANPYIIIDRAIKRGNKELYSYTEYELLNNNSLATEYYQYLFPYFESFIKGDFNYVINSLTKKCVKNGNIDALKSWNRKYANRIFNYSIKFQQYHIAESILNYCDELEIGKSTNKLIKDKKYELFDKMLKHAENNAYSFRRCFELLFYSSDIDFVKKYYPCPKYPRLRYHAFTAVLKTNNPEIMKYVNIEQQIAKHGMFDLISSGNVEFAKKYCVNFHKDNIIRAACSADSVEMVELLLIKGVKLKKILYCAAGACSKKIVEKYFDEMSSTDRSLFLSMLCRKFRDNFNEMIKIGSIDEIIKKCISNDNFIILHRILETGYELSNKAELLKIVRDRQKIIRKIIEMYA